MAEKYEVSLANADNIIFDFFEENLALSELLLRKSNNNKADKKSAEISPPYMI